MLLEQLRQRITFLLLGIEELDVSVRALQRRVLELEAEKVALKEAFDGRVLRLEAKLRAHGIE